MQRIFLPILSIIQDNIKVLCIPGTAILNMSIGSICTAPGPDPPPPDPDPPIADPPRPPPRPPPLLFPLPPPPLLP